MCEEDFADHLSATFIRRVLRDGKDRTDKEWNDVLYKSGECALVAIDEIEEAVTKILEHLKMTTAEKSVVGHYLDFYKSTRDCIIKEQKSFLNLIK